jgi:pyruvate formate lyase activating enzyme
MVSGQCAAICPSEALQVVGAPWTTSQVMAEVERDRAFYETSGGGVTFSGGEPLAQFDFLFALLTECRRAGIHAVLDTSGHAPWSLLKRTIPLVGLYLYDLKLMDEHRHLQWTGVSNADILANLKRLSGSGSEVLIRIPLIPGINDDEQNLRQTAEFMAGLDTQPLVELLPYHNIAAGKYSGLGREDPLPGLKPSDPGKKEACAALLREYDIRVVT